MRPQASGRIARSRRLDSSWQVSQAGKPDLQGFPAPRDDYSNTSLGRQPWVSLRSQLRSELARA